MYIDPLIIVGIVILGLRCTHKTMYPIPKEKEDVIIFRSQGILIGILVPLVIQVIVNIFVFISEII